MSLAKKILSAILAAGMSILPVVSNAASAVGDQKNPYVYDTTISEKSKDLAIEEEQPFNVFDIYDAYYEMISKQTVPVTTVTTTKKTTTSTTKKTTAAPKTTTSKKITTTQKTTASTKKTTTLTTTAASTTMKPQTSFTTTASVTAPVTTVVTTQVGQFPDGKYINGIDVSQWQYLIDWQAVKNSGQVDFAIIKAGWGKETYQVDPFFHQNMQQAQAVGMDVGVYWFSYAMSVEEAKQEALVCLETIKDYSFNYPVYYDFEYQKALTSLSYATLSEMIEVFCTTLEEHGYKTGVYGSGSDFEYRIYRHVLEKRPVWVAEYDTPTVTWYKGTHGIWQYSHTGKIDGSVGKTEDIGPTATRGLHFAVVHHNVFLHQFAHQLGHSGYTNVQSLGEFCECGLTGNGHIGYDALFYQHILVGYSFESLGVVLIKKIFQKCHSEFCQNFI